MANRLAQETSPYLLQHKDNPVDWYPWGAEALAKARDEDRPIFLSVGYAACHWCHVMAHESFEDRETAAFLNEHFVPVKVDREERPDIDAIYMDAVQAMTGRGGWPMSVFLTPDGKPFYGGTYFPNSRRYGMPSFRDVLEGIAEVWSERRGEAEQSGERIADVIARGDRPHTHARGTAPAPEPGTAPAPEPGTAPAGTAEPVPDVAPVSDVASVPDAAVSDAATARLVDTFDWANGSWGGAPKFPQPMTIEFLLRRIVGPGDDAPIVTADGGDLEPARARLLRMVTKTLDAMADGGMRDQLGGGFHRYSTDEVWLVPHFEKMLYDNAQLARVYLHAWQLTGEQRYREVVESTIDYVAREMTLPDGGFAASQDADSLGPDGHPEEGAFYTWSLAEIESAVGEEAPLLAAAYDVRTTGNWDGRAILRRVRTDGELAALFETPDSFAMPDSPGTPDSLAMPDSPGTPDTLALADPPDAPDPSPAADPPGRANQTRPRTAVPVAERLASARARALNARGRRPPPARDDKVLASWNGLMLAAVAEAARAFDRADYLALAQRNATFVLGHLRTPDGRLRRSWKDGRATLNGYLEDYTDLAEGLLALYETTFDDTWFIAARDLVDQVLAHFRDPSGGFFDTSDDHEQLVARPKGLQDNAVPSGNAMAATALLKLASWTGDGLYRDAAEGALRLAGEYLGRYPTSFAQWLIALDFALAPVREVAIVVPPVAPSPASDRVEQSVEEAVEDGAARAISGALAGAGELLAVVRSGFRPHQVVAVGGAGAIGGAGAVAPVGAVGTGGSEPTIPLLKDRSVVGGRATAYVCRAFACRLPVTDRDALAGELREGPVSTR